ncbi:MAG: hypothetical protein SVC26_02310 [Pseudomonadota bacterium]|nr:hypothetical protein [Pseudomonadota bacterium]
MEGFVWFYRVSVAVMVISVVGIFAHTFSGGVTPAEVNTQAEMTTCIESSNCSNEKGLL